MLKERVLQIIAVAFTTAILASLILSMPTELLLSAGFHCGVTAAATSAVTAVYTVKSKGNSKNIRNLDGKK